MSSAMPPWFFDPRGLSDVYGNQLGRRATAFTIRGRSTTRTTASMKTMTMEWSIKGRTDWMIRLRRRHERPDDFGHTPTVTPIRLGVDDVGERETTPPYDKPLRGMQVLIRTYEHDSRAIRQVRVNQHFMQE